MLPADAVLVSLGEALDDVCDQLLQRGVLTDPEHPARVALTKAQAANALAYDWIVAARQARKS